MEAHPRSPSSEMPAVVWADPMPQADGRAEGGQATEARPGDRSAETYELALLVARQNGLEAALPHFIAALRGDEEQPHYWLSLSDALLSLGRLTEAKALITLFATRTFADGLAQTIKTRLIDSLLAHAAELLSASAIDAAELLYDSVLTLDATNAPGLHGAAQVTAFRGRIDDAIALLGLAIAQDDRSAEYHSDLARLLRVAGRPGAALDHARQALALRADSVPARTVQLAALWELGRTDEAMALYREATVDDAELFRGVRELEGLIRHARSGGAADRRPLVRGARSQGPGYGPVSDAVFYIGAPPYTYLSGGPLALHLLCHHLNALGYEAFIATESVSGALRTPVLTSSVRRAHAEAGRRRIAIYPEVAHGNPLDGDHVIRYLLNTPGSRCAHTNDDLYKFWLAPERRHEYIMHYAEEFQAPFLKSDPLWIPLVDRKIYHRTSDARPRKGFLVYEHRTQVTAEMIPEWAHPVTMISMSRFRTPEELADLYRSSEALIVFERTGAIGEALLCGCPVVAVPGDTFKEIPMFNRVGNLGVGWGASLDQLAWAQRTVDAVCNVHHAYDIATPTEVGARIEAALTFFDRAEPWQL